MSDQRNNDVITLLANDALEAADDKHPLATILLIDAALCILVTRLNGAGAREMASILTQYMTEQIATHTSISGAA